MTLQTDFSFQDSTVAAKLTLPKAIAHDCVLCTAATIIVRWRDHPSKRWLHTQDVKEVAAHHERIYRPAFDTVPSIQTGGIQRCNFRKSLLLLTHLIPKVASEVRVIGIKISCAAMRGVYDAYRRQTIGPGNRKHAQPHGI